MRTRAAMALVAVLLLAGCATLPHPTGPEAPAWRDARLLDAAPASRLLVEVDRVQGTRPRPRALRRFALALRDIVDKPGGVELVVDDLIPASEWQESDRVVRALARTHRSLELPRPGELAVAHVLYGPRLHSYRGFAFTRQVMGQSAPRYEAPLILILQDRLRSVLWVTDVRQEASVLVHEFGHALGLVGDPSHGQDGHCTHAWCSMYAGVDAASLALYFFPTLFTGYLPMRYCADCRLDLYPEEHGVPPGKRSE